MSDTVPTAPVVVNQPDPPGGDKPNPPQGDTTVPYSRFKEVNERLKALQTAEETRLAEAKKADEAKLLEQKKYEDLLKVKESELETVRKQAQELQEKAEQFDATQKQIREQALAKIKDERMRGIAAELSTPRLLEFVESTNVSQPPFDGKGAPGGGGKADELAIKLGESAQAYRERMAQRKRTGA